MSAAVAKAAVAGAASSAAGSAAEETVKKNVTITHKSKGGGRRRRARQPAADSTLVIALAVLGGMGFIRYALVDKTVPPRRWWVGTLVTAVFLSIATDLTPKLGRSFSYMVILAAVLQHSVPIFDELTKIDKESGGGDAGRGERAVSSELGNTLLPPVFLRGGANGYVPKGGAGAQTERFVANQRTPRTRAKRSTNAKRSPYGTSRY